MCVCACVCVCIYVCVCVCVYMCVCVCVLYFTMEYFKANYHIKALGIYMFVSKGFSVGVKRRELQTKKGYKRYK